VRDDRERAPTLDDILEGRLAGHGGCETGRAGATAEI
jgi:hypothetical protein